MISLGRDLIASLNGTTLTFKRKAKGSYVRGLWVDGDEEEVSIFASVQPLGGKDLMRIPEGDRTRKRLKLYSADEALISLRVDLIESDVIPYDGSSYQVESVEKWPSYWKIIVAEVNKIEESPVVPEPPDEEVEP